MPRAINDHVAIEYDTFGDPADPTVLLVMGFTAQMTAWEAEFCQLIAGHGRHVVRFDNRDCGLSTKSAGPPPNLMTMFAAAMSGADIGAAPYTLTDMAGDGLAVLDDLGVERANVVGASMGGMIAQTMAIEFPERVASLTSIMSTTGDRNVGQASPAAMQALLATPPSDRQGYVDATVETWRVISGSYPIDEDRLRERLAASYDRSFHPEGASFQMAAILDSGNRTERLGSITAPTLVIHGAEDPLIGPSGGEATAAAIPDAELVVYEQMGHDLPIQLWDELTTRIAKHAR